MTRRNVKKSRNQLFLEVWRAKMTLNLIKKPQKFVCQFKTWQSMCVWSLIFRKRSVQILWRMKHGPAVLKTSQNCKSVNNFCPWLSEKIENCSYFLEIKSTWTANFTGANYSHFKFFQTIMDRNFEKMKKKLNNEHHKLFVFAIINPEDSNTTARLFSSFVQPRLKTWDLES